MIKDDPQPEGNRNSFNLNFFGLEINSKEFQAIIQSNIDQSKYTQTIQNAFKFLSLLEKYRMTNDVNTEQIIKSSFQNKLLDSRLAPINYIPVQIINPSKPFPLKKVGKKTGNPAERQCKLTKDGIFQFKDNKVSTIKSVVQIQKKGEGKLSDIEWIKDHTKYPYRVVMKNEDNLLRTVFAQSPEEAKQIQDFCILHLSKVSEKIGRFVEIGAKRFKDQVSYACAERISVVNRKDSSKGKNRAAEREKKRKQAVRQLLQRNSDKATFSDMIKNWLHLSIDRNHRTLDQNGSIAPPAPPTPSTPPPPQREPDPQTGNTRQLKTGDFIENFTLIFQRIQLLNQSEIMRKPVLDIEIATGGQEILYQQTFDTILQKKDPHLIYALFSQNPALKQIDLQQQLNKLQIRITVSDKLRPTKITHSLRLRVKQRVNQLMYLASFDGAVRLQVRYKTADDTTNDDTKQKYVNEDGLVLICKQLDNLDIEKIKKKYWNPANKNEYYSDNTTFDVTEILGRLDVVPKFWWLGVTEEQYQILNLLDATSETLSFILIQSHLYIIRSLIKIFQNNDKMVQKVFKSFLAIILYYLKPYFSRPQFDKIQKLHTLLGVDFNCSLPMKMSLQLNALNKILNLQIPDLMEKYKHKNVHLGLICYQYLFELYSRNFNIRLLTSLWNYLFKSPDVIQENLLLLSVVLIKINAYSLLKVYRYPEIIHVLTQQTKTYSDFNNIVHQLQSLRKKYFTKPESVFENAKAKLFEENPFEEVLNSFYKKQNAKLDNSTKNKTGEKKKALEKLINHKYEFTLPKYPSKTHNLHIYFHKLPNIEPYILELKIKNVEHQCTKIRPDTYYIVRKVNSPVEIVLTYAGKKWSAVAELIQGIHYSSITLTEEKNSESVFVVQITAGFLTESQEVAILRGKPNEHYLGSYMKFENIVGECLRQIGGCSFLDTAAKAKIPYEITQQLKVLFTSGSNRFNDIDFYLSWIIELKISPLQKLQKLKLYAQTIWTELFHSSSHQLYKILFREFLDKMNFPIEDEQFEFLYNGSLDEFDCPRIISLKFLNQDKKKVRLDKHIQKLVSEKSSKCLLSDIIIDHKNLLSTVLMHLVREKVTNINGVLILKYSSYGQVKKRIIPLKYDKTVNELTINNQHELYVPGTYKIRDITPELLGTESYPSFSRITNRLYNENTELSTLKSKYIQGEDYDLEKKKSSETLNVIGCMYDKLKCVLPMRYRKECFITQLPFFSYFSELMYQIVYPPLPKLFFEAVEVPPIRICTYNGALELSDNNRNENEQVEIRLGLHGNISKWNFQTPIIYFWSSKKKESFKIPYPVFVNYGEGVFRTQQCIVHGYCRSTKNKYKIFFIVELQGKSILIPREELLVDNIDIFAQIDLNNQKLSRFKKTIKEYEGKTKEEKSNEVVQNMKFTNNSKWDREFSDVKNLDDYIKKYDFS